ncbi:uncharacterized protein PITG_15423 [Phytophthora infestans T30-4]|uniref:DDE-1 domain-containing protein n=1 Tax=Phytophthora infestans (strain T30-4) TaxID=403677 RepID=D0NR79_PHYIT|nr:uncharacterized protein PITG_15423 [Phytophthora infestans T30-4]EEY63201.1 conserved hypothetical protein [Phytophthora infestans T30-4]|eukprot:XP_002898378.1 conserved hypothetical protein [Phytophthora infestans T30-4]
MSLTLPQKQSLCEKHKSDPACSHSELARWATERFMTPKLPPNTTAVLQPMDQGIMKCLKNEYQNKKQAAELDLFYKGVSYRPVDVYSAMKWLSEGWNNISAKTIRNCWCHTGIVNQDSQRPHTRRQKHPVAGITEFRRFIRRIHRPTAIRKLPKVPTVELLKLRFQEEDIFVRFIRQEVGRDGSDRGDTSDSEDAGHQANTECQRQTKSRQSKGHSVFLPAKDAPVKRSKKDRDLSTLASSVSTLVNHIVGQPAAPKARELSTVHADLALVRRNVAEVGDRVADIESKLDAIADTVADSVTKAVLATVTAMLAQSHHIVSWKPLTTTSFKLPRDPSFEAPTPNPKGASKAGIILPTVIIEKLCGHVPVSTAFALHDAGHVTSSQRFASTRLHVVALLVRVTSEGFMTFEPDFVQLATY